VGEREGVYVCECECVWAWALERDEMKRNFWRFGQISQSEWMNNAFSFDFEKLFGKNHCLSQGN